MMTRWLLLTWTITLLSPLAVAEEGSSSEAEPKPRIRVLFVGNSYTYENNLPACLSAIGADYARIDTEMVVAGGATLARHWTEGIAAARVRDEEWDFVVLQEQSTLGRTRFVNGEALIDEPAEFYRAVIRFNMIIEARGGQTILLATWPRQRQPEKLALLHRAYTKVGREIGASVVPIGVAWARIATRVPEWNLYGPDGSHPGPGGTYVTATALLSEVLGTLTPDLPSDITVQLMNGYGKPTVESYTHAVSRDRREALAEVIDSVNVDRSKNGGFIDLVPKPQLVDLDLPTGAVISESAISGSWSGQTMLLPDLTTTISLDLRSVSGALEVDVTLDHDRAGETRREKYALVDARVEGDRLLMAHSTSVVYTENLRYEFVAADGNLVGIVRSGSIELPFVCSAITLSKASE